MPWICSVARTLRHRVVTPVTGGRHYPRGVRLASALPIGTRCTALDALTVRGVGVVTPVTLDEAVAALAEHPDALVLAGGTDLMVEVNEAHRRLTGRETVVAVGRVAELRSWVHDPVARTRAPRRRRDLRRARPGAAGVAAPGARPGGAHRRLAADPQRGDHRRQPGDVLAGRRRAAGARRARRRGRAASARRPAHVADRRVHGRRQAHGAPARRADRRGHRPAARRLAGLRQGRRAQRHGHRHRRRLPRRRPAVALGPPRPRLGRRRRSCARRRPRRSPRRASTGTPAPSTTTPSSASASSPPPPAGPIDDHRSTAAYRRRAVEVLAGRLLRARVRRMAPR